MIDRERVARLDGALLFLSMSMGVKPYDYLFGAKVIALDKGGPLESYVALCKENEERYGKIAGDGQQFSYFSKTTEKYLTRYIKNSFLKKIGNQGHIIWKVTDEIDCLFDWGMPEEVYMCDYRRILLNQQGHKFFIPVGNECLVLTWLCKGGLLDQAA